MSDEPFGLYKWVGIQINFFEIYNFLFDLVKKTWYFEKIWTLQDLGSNFQNFLGGANPSPPLRFRSLRDPQFVCLITQSYLGQIVW
jgi:hypothetical protein